MMDIGGENKEHCDKVIKEILEHWNDNFDSENEQKS